MEATLLRPLGLGEILDVAIKIFVRNAGTFVRIVVFVVAPVEVVSALVQASALPDELANPSFGFEPLEPEPLTAREIWIAVAAYAVIVVLTILASTVATGACYKAVASAYLGEAPSWRGSLGFALRRLHSILWVTILGGVLAVLGLVFCIVPGVYLWVAFAVAVPVLLTEGIKGRRALGRSRRLVRGRWWPTFGLLLLGFLLAGFVAFVVGGLVGVATLWEGGDDPAVYLPITAVGNVVASLVTTPFSAAFVTVLYFDLRVRKEGFDLALLAERIGVEPDPSRSPLPPPPVATPPWEAPAAPSAPSGSAPPYWPPPPGWQPSAEPEPPPASEPSAQPPYWPPPPGWRPPGDGRKS
jgi:hypothetical protein